VFAIAISFGVLARPLMGLVAPIVMSIVVFSGAAQFGALAVLLAGGSTAAAIAAGVLLNARYLAMGLALAPSLRGKCAVARGVRDAAGRRVVGGGESGATARSTPGTWSESASRSTSAGCWAPSSGPGRVHGSATRRRSVSTRCSPPSFIALLFEEARGRRGSPRPPAEPDRSRADPARARGLPILAAAAAAVAASRMRP
jgi:hypothetical protein